MSTYAVLKASSVVCLGLRDEQVVLLAVNVVTRILWVTCPGLKWTKALTISGRGMEDMWKGGLGKGFRVFSHDQTHCELTGNKETEPDPYIEYNFCPS